MKRLDAYTAALRDLSSFLSSVDEKRWSTRIADWLQELSLARSNSKLINEHVIRTKKAIGGMGSIGDIFISHRNGLAKHYSQRDLPKLNRTFGELVTALSEAVDKLAADIRTTNPEE